MMTRITHALAAPIVTEAFARVFKRDPTRPERQLCQAVGWVETGYAQHWDKRGAGSFNWGALQAHAGWQGETFEYVDTAPQPDGTSKPYHQAFRKYATNEDGATDLVRVVYTGGRNPPLFSTKKYGANGSRWALVQPAAERGSIEDFSAALYDTVYFQGFGRTRADRIGHHVRAVRNACTHAALELREPMPDGSEPPKPIPVYRLGMRGGGIDTIQRLIGVLDDDYFGPATQIGLKAWQQKHKLKPDGVWGPVCFHIAATELTGDEVDNLRGLLP